ncbi:hypothetical protein [Aureimonas leprariae]|nr:hypothetical protein [Aureimonas leprariae]
MARLVIGAVLAVGVVAVVALGWIDRDTILHADRPSPPAAVDSR